MHLLKEARFGGPKARFGTDIVATDVAMDDSLVYDREGEPTQLVVVDIFVSTVDPLKEPPLVTANTLLSKMCLHEWLQSITGKFIIPRISNIASIWFASLFVSIFATVHGHTNAYNATIFPHNVGLGVTRDPELIKSIGAATALEVRATSIPYSFTPCIAVCRDPR